MIRISTLVSSLLLSFVLVSAASADSNASGDPPPCGFFCKFWRNVSGKTHVSYENHYDAQHVDSRLQAPEEGAALPSVRELVTVHGSIIAETPNERRQREKQRSAMIKSLEKDEDAPR